MKKRITVTEKYCRHCGETKPVSEFYNGYTTTDGYGSWCKRCVSQASARRIDQKYHTDSDYRKLHVSRVAKRNKERKSIDPEFRKRQNKYTADYRKRRKELDPEYYEEGKVKANARYKKRMENPLYRALRAAWMNVVTHRRRSRKAGQGGSHTVEEWKIVKRNQNGLCLACGQRKSPTKDHIIPIEKGGTDDIQNIQGLCLGCNRRKGTRIIDYRKS